MRSRPGSATEIGKGCVEELRSDDHRDGDAKVEYPRFSVDRFHLFRIATQAGVKQASATPNSMTTRSCSWRGGDSSLGAKGRQQVDTLLVPRAKSPGLNRSQHTYG